MQRFRQWLSQTTQLMRGGQQTQPLRLVLGNTSYDVDSCIGSIGLAYFYSITLDQNWVPIMNCNR